MGRVWSSYQNNIFDFVKFGQGNAIVEAVAGSGKSTTMVEAQKLVQTRTNVFLAFNKSIADELKQRGVNARTFHSLTYSPVTRHKNVRNITENKLRQLIDKNLSGNDAAMYGSFIAKLVGLGRQSGIDCIVPDIQSEWVELVEYHDLELENDKAELGRALELASQLLHWSNQSNMIDFDDLLYIPVKEGLSLQKFDYVFVDEAQDTNAIQRALIRKIIHQNSRIIAVGDPAQAIYGFRGADTNSLNLIAEEFNCSKLPLTVSYRCPTSVVNFAHTWVEHIQAAPDAPEGEVQKLDTKWDLQMFQPEDLIVCRTTKPLVALAFKFLRAKIPARIMGREIGTSLINLINKMRARDVDHLLEKLEIWEAREVEKALVKQQDNRIESIHDQFEAITCLVDGLDEDDRTITALITTISSLFDEVQNAVILATIHKSKGLEADRVWWLNASKCPAQWAKQEWQKQQERNLCYVAVTRAKKSLFMIEEGA